MSARCGRNAPVVHPATEAGFEQSLQPYFSRDSVSRWCVIAVDLVTLGATWRDAKGQHALIVEPVLTTRFGSSYCHF